MKWTSHTSIHTPPHAHTPAGYEPPPADGKAQRKALAVLAAFVHGFAQGGTPHNSWCVSLVSCLCVLFMNEGRNVIGAHFLVRVPCLCLCFY